jgi:hypothetical protein
MLLFRQPMAPLPVIVVLFMAMTGTKRTRREQTMLRVPIDQNVHKKSKLKCMAVATTMAKQIERLMEDFVKGRIHAERA